MRENVDLFLNHTNMLKRLVNQDSCNWEGNVDSTKLLLDFLINKINVEELDINYDYGNYDPYPPTIHYKENKIDCYVNDDGNNEYCLNNNKCYNNIEGIVNEII